MSRQKPLTSQRASADYTAEQSSAQGLQSPPMPVPLPTRFQPKACPNCQKQSRQNSAAAREARQVLAAIKKEIGDRRA